MHVRLHVHAIADLALDAMEGTASLMMMVGDGQVGGGGFETKYNWVNLRR